MVIVIALRRRVSKKKEPAKIVIYEEFKPQIKKALQFIDARRTSPDRHSYWEIEEQNDTEYKIFKQTQYLLSILFKNVDRADLAQKIRTVHSPHNDDNDPNRKDRKAGDAYCVLDKTNEVLPKFYLEECKDALNNDEKVLLALYWLKKKYVYNNWREEFLDFLIGIIGEKIKDKKMREYRDNANRLYHSLKQMYRPDGVLEMDKADSEKNQYSIYKVALLGILANKMNDMDVLQRVKKSLVYWQQQSNRNGGWITDLTADLKLIGLANVETTALSILALNSLIIL